MSKQTPILAERAKDLYVKNNYTFEEIAARLNVSERTVRNWKDKDGSWKRERDAYIESRKSLHEDLYDFTREVMSSIRDDFRSGSDVSDTRWKAFRDLVNWVFKPQDYEEVRVRRETNKNVQSTKSIALSILSAMGMADGSADDEDEDKGDEE